MKAGWMVVAGALFACMGVFVKLASAQFSAAELVFYRSIFGLAVIYAMIRIHGGTLATKYWRGHLARALSGFCALVLFFYAIAQLPLGTAFTLNYTAPIFLALIATLWLGEKPHLPLLVALAVGFSGVALLLRPTLDGGEAFAGALGLLSGLLAAVAYLNVRQLGRAGEPDWRIVFYFSLVSTVGAGAWMAASRLHPVDWGNVGMLAGMGFTATLAQLAMTRAYRLGRTLVVGSLAYVTPVFSTLAGLVLWDDSLPMESWAGMALIIGAGIVAVRTSPREVGPT